MRVSTQQCTFFKHFSDFVFLMVALVSAFGFMNQVSAFGAELDVLPKHEAINSPSRAPANFVPDDDMIVVPMIIERNFYEDFNEKHKDRFKQSRQKLEGWILQEQYAIDHGLEDTGIVPLPTAADKERFLNRNYLRFIQKDVERSNNETLQGLVNSWTTDDEINAIENTEQQGEFIIKAKKSRGQKVVKAKKTVKVGKRKFKFDIQPRLEQGMVIIRLKSDIVNARAWIGVNGKQEVRIRRKFKSTGTRLWANFFVDERRTLAAASQKFGQYWSMRFTHEKYESDSVRLTEGVIQENNILSVNFRMGF